MTKPKKKVSKRARREKDPTKMSTDEYALWAKTKTDEQIREWFPERRLPPRPYVGESQSDVERKILEKLPEPPPSFSSEREVLAWLREVIDLGGSSAFELVFSSNRFWPFSARMRQDVWSPALKLRDDAAAADKAKAAARAEEIREKARKTAEGKASKKWFNTRTGANV